MPVFDTYIVSLCSLQFCGLYIMYDDEANKKGPTCAHCFVIVVQVFDSGKVLLAVIFDDQDGEAK